MHDLIAVLDVGKTHSKLSVVNAASGELVQTVQRVNRPQRALGIDQLDLAGTQAWLLATLRELPCRSRITALVPVAHGAACVLVDDAGGVLAAPDYEDHGFEASAAEYALERDPFADTRSPRLPAGLNLGAQLHFMESRHTALWARTHQILLLPQFWSWRLSGIAATEVSSLGAHTDLWQPERRAYSALALRRGWCERFPPLRWAGEALGPLAEEVLCATGLRAGCAVLCGLHDSNASWLAHRRTVPADAGLTVISSGTWTIAMKAHADLSRLVEQRDMLANVDVFGAPLATARFMGGREYAAIVGAVAGAPAGTASATPTRADLARVIAADALALPAFAESGGPFQGQVGRLERADALSAGERAALASLYVTLVIDVMLELLGDSDTVIIDGPFAANPLIPGLLQALRPGSKITASLQGAGQSAGARCLVLGDAATACVAAHRRVEAIAPAGLAAYRSAWQSRLAP